MITLGVILLIWLVVCIVDLLCYGHAKFPERTRHWWAYLPGGGCVVLWRYRKDVVVEKRRA